VITVQGLRKAYGTLVAVDAVSFAVPAGSTFGLLGPNGAGKTTLIHVLAGVLKPDAGTITLNGQADPSRPEVRRQLGIAPQALAVYADLTAEENLAFFGRTYGLGGPRLKERVGWALEFAGLADRRRDRAGTFSGGMKRRLNLACGLVHDPPVLFLDEPTAGVDPQSRNHLLESIEGLARQGKTILYTTHYMEEAQRLCQRIAILDHGQILALDTLPNLLAAYGRRSLVEFELDGPPDPGAALPGPLVEGNRLVLETERPLAELEALTARGLKVASFRVDRPNLEAVFLALTGRRLRD
jgi:ABC-2 type transport system ATP-binding protein